MPSADDEQIRRIVKTALAEAKDDASAIIATPSLAHDGLLDRLWHWTRRDVVKENRGVRLLRRVLTYLKFCTGDYSQSWQPCARAAADEVAAHLNVDCCIGEHSPDAGLFLGRWFSRRYRVPWIMDFRDPAVLQHPRVAQVLRRPILRFQLRRAQLTINVSPFWAECDRVDFRRPSVCIPNGFDPEEYPNRDARGTGLPLTVVYTGNINAGQVAPFLGLEVFLKGLALARATSRPSVPSVQFEYYGGSHRLIAEFAEKYGVADTVHSHAAIPRSDAVSRLVASDLLLLISTGKPESEARYYSLGFYPGKVFEYFGARRPILCVPGDHGQLDSLIRETNTGIICRTTEAVAEFLRGAVATLRRGDDLPYHPDAGNVARYARRNLTGRLAGCLDECTATSAVTRQDRTPMKVRI